jgi:tetratricopeptide (TPR) repeat protein
MSINEFDSEKLIKRLQQLPELEPPATIVSDVMGKIKPVRQPLYQRLWNYLLTPWHFTLRPLPTVCASALMLAVFWLGMETGMYRAQPANVKGKINIVERAMQDAEASFLVGRGLMAAGLVAEALPLFEKATVYTPDNPEYAYWQGLCFWANGMPEKERLSYLRGVGASPDNVPLLINLGHNLFEQGELNAAKLQYEKVLAIASQDSEALYNRGLIYHLQQDYENEKIGWKTYLQYNRSGKKSFRAVERLNNLNDFTYRAYQLGNRKIILSPSALLNISPMGEINREVERLAHGMKNDSTLQVDLVIFQEDDELVARKKAIVLKKNILAILGKKESKRVRLSWFGEKETIQTSGGTYRLPESLLLFGRHNIFKEKETQI